MTHKIDLKYCKIYKNLTHYALYFYQMYYKMSKQKRKCIDLKTKYDIISDIEKRLDYNLIVNKYELSGKSVVSNLRSQKEKIKSAFESGDFNSKYKRLRNAKYDEIDDAVMKWFTIARKSKISLSGPIVKEQALEFAAQLGYTDFTASDGWLTSFKERHSIVFRSVSGESATVDQTVIDDWVQNKLPEIIKDIFVSHFNTF